MRTSVKITLGIGALLIIGGILSVRSSFGEFERVEDPFSSDELPSLENVTNGSITLNDEDGLGEVGVTFWMEGEYSDENKDGVWDHCEKINITILSHPEISDEEFWGEEARELNGSFYYETSPLEKSEGFAAEGCETKEENRNYDLKERGLIKVGRACLACYSGTMVFESNMSVWVTYDDPILGQLLEGLGSLALGALMCGCGLLFLIIGGLMVVLGGDDDPVPVVMQQAVIGQQPVIAQQQVVAQQAPPTITVVSDSGQDPPSNT